MLHILSLQDTLTPQALLLIAFSPVGLTFLGVLQSHSAPEMWRFQSFWTSGAYGQSCLKLSLPDCFQCSLLIRKAFRMKIIPSARPPLGLGAAPPFDFDISPGWKSLDRAVFTISQGTGLTSGFRSIGINAPKDQRSSRNLQADAVRTLCMAA